MQLTTEQVAKFQAVYKATFGLEISIEQASEQGVELVRLMQLIYKSIKQTDLVKVQKRRTKLESNN